MGTSSASFHSFFFFFFFFLSQVCCNVDCNTMEIEAARFNASIDPILTVLTRRI